MLEGLSEMLGFGESDEDKVKRERMQRYREAMERAKSYGVPSGVPAVAAMTAQMHAQQGQALQGMADRTMQTIQRENDSRLAQIRERRRMEHEKELAMMQARIKQQESEGDIIRSLLNG